MTTTATTVPSNDPLLPRLRRLEDTVAAGDLDALLDRVGVGDAYGVVDGPIGPTWVAHNDHGVAFTFLTDDEQEFITRHCDRLPRRLRRAPVPDEIATAIAASDGSALIVDLRHVAPFQRDVLEATRSVRPGQTRSYGWVAQQIGRPAAVRAVGSALARNPIPIIIPCHRIVRGDGDVGSYLFGADRKRLLLQIEGRVNARCSFAIDTAAVAADLDGEGHAVVPGLLDAATAEELVAGFDDDHRYRSTIDMARHGYGVGTYRYFAYPLPVTVATLREQLYRQLVPIADQWAERLGTGERYPDELAEFLARCAAAGQERPTPLILRYRPGHYNCLHQDRYGEVAFPLQVAVLLTPRAEFDGGELVLVEQRPRAQSRAHVVSLQQGDAVVFPNQVRPALGTRGPYRVQVRHGVATLRRGGRHVLGVIFHDAA